MPLITPRVPQPPGPFVTIPAFLNPSSPCNNYFLAHLLSPVDGCAKAILLETFTCQSPGVEQSTQATLFSHHCASHVRHLTTLADVASLRLPPPLASATVACISFSVCFIVE